MRRNRTFRMAHLSRELQSNEHLAAQRAALKQLTHDVELEHGSEAHVLDSQHLHDTIVERSSVKQVTREDELKVAAEQSERNLRQLNDRLTISNQRLAAANADLEAFSYSVAHDLRSPIRQIAGFSKILHEEYGAQLPADALRYLDKVERGAQHMGRLVDDLLHLAHVGRQILSLQIMPLNSILAAALEILRPDCFDRQIEWRIDKLYNVACDQGLITQVFVNLLSNALKYTRSRCPAVIEVGQIEMEGEHVVFVRDNGVGFDMQYADKLFGTFQRLHSTSEFEGTGIGLATVKRIISKHSGQVWAQAEVGRGATFFFHLHSPAR